MSSSTAPVVCVQSLNPRCSATADRYLGDLEIEGIIERPPSPVPLADRNPDDLTPDELREQVRLLRARESMVNVKQEFKREKRSRQRSVTLGAGEDDEEGNVTVTGQWDRRKRARASADGEDVVDLTEE